ncbi:MAG: AraC family ligand binding domain-containing protein, partial [Planctomycetota bacterium]
MEDLRCSFRPRTRHSVRSHAHAHIEWHYVIGGSCDLVIAQHSRRIGRGELCAVPAHRAHHIRMRTAGDWLLQYVLLHDPAPDLWRAWNRRCGNAGSMHIGLIHQADFARFARDSAAGTPWARRAATLRFEALLCALLADTASGGGRHPAVDRALALMHRRLRGRLDLDELATHVGLSRHHFSRLFA